MVKIYEKATNNEVLFGELIVNTKTFFKVHSSSKTYKKSEFYYLKKI